MRFPFGRLMLFFLITAGLFGVFGFAFHSINPIFGFYKDIARFSLMASAVCLVLCLTVTLFRPKSLFEPGRSLYGVSKLGDKVFGKIPYFRISLLSLVISLALFWIHNLVFPVGFTVFLVSIEMFLARMLFFVYGSAYRSW